MKSAGLSISALLLGLCLAQMAGCQYRYDDWQALKVGQSTAHDVQTVFRTPVGPEDRYAYALDQNQTSDNIVLMMVDLDDDGIVSAKYYWHSIPRPILPLWNMDTWEMALETEIPPSQLQEYSPTLGPREEAILEYFGRRLFDTAGRFDHLNEVFGSSGSMTQILTRAALQYNMRADKQTLLSEGGFEFDGGIHGNKCTMELLATDQRRGLYTLVLKGSRQRNFFSGW